MLLGLCDLIPPACGRTEGVGEGYVVSMGEQILHGPWIALHELVACLLELFEYFVEIVYRSYCDITSIALVLSLDTLCDHPTLFTGVRGRVILRSLPKRR